MKYVRRLAPLLLLLALLAPRDGDSCGPFLEEVQFTTYHRPVESEFRSGQYGVMRPGYYRGSLLVAFRALSGLAANSDDRAMLLPKESRRITDPDAPRTAIERWLAARKLVPGAGAVQGIDREKGVPGKDFQFFTNCLDDAFDGAAKALDSRISRWGAGSPLTAEWLRGQDAVFQNCHGGPAIPSPAPDPRLAADRAYQIAAAKFYALQFPEAQADFDAIAADSASPWHEIAPYLAARACIRDGTLRGDDKKLGEAGELLKAILDDPARKALHESAQGLLDFVKGQLDPVGRIAELGEEWTKPKLGGRFDRIVTDYTMLWDRIESSKMSPPVEQSEVADWINTYHHTRDAAHALEQWRAKRTAPWLLAALVLAKQADEAVPELLAAAHALDRDSPAWATTTYYGIRLEIQRGKTNAARTWADRALASKPPESVTNLLRAERSRLARNWTEFLRFAARKPVAMWGGFEGDTPVDNRLRRSVAFDEDTVRPMNETVPLELWSAAAESPLVPRVLQTDIAQAGWVRAVLLGDPTARRLAERVAQLSPELAPHVRSYLAEGEDAVRKFNAVFLMLRAPGLSPVLRPGLGRETPVLKSDILRDNWWALDVKAFRLPLDAESNPMIDLYPDRNVGSVAFLTGAQRAAGSRQWERLVQEAGNSVNFLAAQTIAWARSHPEDTRVPQALHLVVQATHYGPADRSSSEFSKQAFNLLHRRYPKSEWTAKTKYWY